MHNTISVIRQSIQMSLQNIKSNKMRTFLTTLGIIIGVTAVIALITIVDGVIGSVMGQFSSLGAGTLSVSITGSSLKKGLTESDLDSLEQLENVSGISLPSALLQRLPVPESCWIMCPYRGKMTTISGITIWYPMEGQSPGRMWRTKLMYASSIRIWRIIFFPEKILWEARSLWEESAIR